MNLLPASKMFLILGIILGFLGVAFGAFGAHALKQRISPDYLAIFEVGVRYQMYHALLLIAIAFIYAYFPGNLAYASGLLTFAGTLIFSGSLYILTLSGVTMWGAITPIGGLLLLGGWFMLLLAILKA
jgi:uncharacterized membrane protein YgdD (TMEM256/DUF423 family)